MKINPFRSSVSKEELIQQMTEKRPLPLGRKEFEAWSDRIISGAMVPADKKSQKFALADMIMHLGQTEDHKEDAYFIKTLRKVAVNQVCTEIMKEIRTEIKARLSEEEAQKAKEDLKRAAESTN